MSSETDRSYVHLNKDSNISHFKTVAEIKSPTQYVKSFEEKSYSYYN